MAGCNSKHPISHLLIDRHWYDRPALRRLAQSDRLAIPDTQSRCRGAIEASTGRLRVGRLSQAGCATNDRIGEIDRHIGNALER